MAISFYFKVYISASKENTSSNINQTWANVTFLCDIGFPIVYRRIYRRQLWHPIRCWVIFVSALSFSIFLTQHSSNRVIPADWLREKRRGLYAHIIPRNRKRNFVNIDAKSKMIKKCSCLKVCEICRFITSSKLSHDLFVIDQNYLHWYFLL